MRIRGLFVFLMLLAAATMVSSAAAGPDRAKKRIVGDEVIDTPIEIHAAHDNQQHGAPGGHLPGSRENVTLIGRANIQGAAPGRVADVSAFGNYVYLTVRDPLGCSDAGVAVMDVSSPFHPRQVGFIHATEGSFPGEGSQVINMRTSSFRGQVLVFNNEICAVPGSDGGVTLWDVTNPLRPVLLTAHAGDPDAADLTGGLVQHNEIHSAFAWQNDGRAFVVIVDNYETTDVDILEITNPRRPRFIAELDLNDFGVAQDELLTHGNFQGSFLHDMVVKNVRGDMLMLLSYWDGGWAILNVNDPANPRFVRDSDYPFPDTLLRHVEIPEGNAHQAEFSPNGDFIVGTDEDFSPYRLKDDQLRFTTGPNAGTYPGGVFGWTVPISSYPGGQINGPTIYGGLGCPSNDEYGEQPRIPRASSLPAGPGEEKVVVLLRGLCFFSEKVEQAQNAGYDAVIIPNHHVGSDFGAAPNASLCGSMGHEFTVRIAAVCTGHRAFHLLFNQRPNYEGDPLEDDPEIGTRGARIQASSEFDGWGYVRLLNGRTMREIDSYAIDEALTPRFASGFGDLSVHEVAVDRRVNNLAYLSYYSGGLRVIKYDAGGIREVGHYVHRNGNNFWGVEVHRVRVKGVAITVALLSDRDSGLWIFRYTGS